MALKVIKIYLNSFCRFLKKGSDMAISINSKNNSAKGILNLLEYSHIIFTYAID